MDLDFRILHLMILRLTVRLCVRAFRLGLRWVDRHTGVGFSVEQMGLLSERMAMDCANQGYLERILGRLPRGIFDR